ncbi:flagellar assembly protein [Candidatus Photodesmus blepharus]|uniref:Flagellar assembly protein FliH n=1 Tax=Candidatus Photodesmus blepharonis TaxID=1179155 RepID=A0A084CP01_9GAMM|nr:flagellar assembly protein FliH [Candidatus Photodesmus blepharus]KEY91530.1 flagellar assembly protein [Candidatus Photodesmus blepharus]
MFNKKKLGFLRPNKNQAIVEEAKKWKLPDYSDKTNKKIRKETAVNYNPKRTLNFNEPIKKEIPPLTEEDIESIKKNAYQEGVLKGKETGFKKGYDKGKKQGLDVGYQEGVDQGKIKGIKEGQEFIQQQVQTFIKLADKFNQPLEMITDQIEKQLIDMILILVKEIVHIEVKTNPKIVLDTIKQSIKALPISEHTTILKLHPDDIEIIHSFYSKKELDSRKWILSAESTLNRGDIQIKVNESNLDYKIEDRIQSVIRNFLISNNINSNE